MHWAPTTTLGRCVNHVLASLPLALPRLIKIQYHRLGPLRQLADARWPRSHDEAQSCISDCSLTSALSHAKLH